MNLENLVSEKAIVCNADIASKKRALELLAELLAEQVDPDQSLEIYQQLTEREKLGSTALGHGIALPHARAESCEQAVGAFIKLKQGIDFDSPDDIPTDLLFALMVPKDHTEEHLQILAGLASLFNDRQFRHNLRTASNDTELHSRLTNWFAASQAS